MRITGVACAVALLVPALAMAKSHPDKETKDEAKDDDASDDKAEADDTKPAAKAAATDEADEETTATGKPVGRVTLPGGAFLIDAIVEANLAKSAVGKPISVAPDLWFGASDKLTLGLVHSGRGATGFLTSVVNGLCFNGGGSTGVCASGLGKIYTSVGAEARIGLAEGDFALALPFGIYASAWDPKVVLSAKVGLLARLRAGSVGIELAPSLFAGLTQRTASVNGMTVSTNEDRLALPVTFFFSLSQAFAITAQSGVTLVVEHAKDTYQVPVALGLAWWATPRFSLDIAFGLGAVLDANSMTKAFDSRNLTIGVGYGM